MMLGWRRRRNLKKKNDDDDNDDSVYDDIAPTSVTCVKRCYISRQGKGKVHPRTGPEGPGEE